MGSIQKHSTEMEVLRFFSKSTEMYIKKCSESIKSKSTHNREKCPYDLYII